MGLERTCSNADEASLADTYVKSGVPVRNFDTFANQCAKYGYRVPSKEKFMAAYNGNQADRCVNSKKYFQAAYTTFHRRGSVAECESSAMVESFNSASVQEDAFQAYQLKTEMDVLDRKIEEAHGNKKKYNDDLLIDTIARAAFEASPAALKEKRAAKGEQLKLLTKKYGLFVSDLESL